MHDICLVSMDRVFQDYTSDLLPLSTLERQQRLLAELREIFGEQSNAGLTQLFVLLKNPGTIGKIKYTGVFEQQYLLTVEKLIQLLYVL